MVTKNNSDASEHTSSGRTKVGRTVPTKTIGGVRKAHPFPNRKHST